MRPVCKACGRRAPLINQRCVPCMSLETECWLDTVAAEDVLVERAAS